MERVTRFSLGVLLLADVFSAVRVTQDQFVAVPPGDPVEMKCEQDDSSFLYLYWYRQYRGAGLALVGTSVRGSDPTLEEAFKHGYEVTRPDALRSTLRVLAGAANHSATYFCATSQGQGAYEKLYFGAGTRLTVLEKDVPAREPKVVLFDPSEQEIRQKKKATLVCLASNFYPGFATITWSVNGENRTEGVQTDDDPTRDVGSQMYSMTSRLRLSKREWFSSWRTFQCTVHIYHPKEKDIQRETRGREECGITEDSYKRQATSAKITYILLLCKAALHGLVVTFLAWTLKVNDKHFS